MTKPFFLLAEEDEEEEHYLTKSFKYAIVVGIILYFIPNILPFGFWDAWTTKEPSGFAVWIQSVWPIFVWGAGYNLLIAFMHRDDWDQFQNPFGRLIYGLYRSCKAGLFEEIAFRWLLFMGFIVSAKWTNFILLGFIGPKFELVRSFHLYIIGPIANTATLGYLSEYLVNPEIWAVGAGIITTNTLFRDGHAYQGPIGWINSWFLGMVFFWVMFHHGLVAAIVVHALYNANIYFSWMLISLLHRVFVYVPPVE